MTSEELRIMQFLGRGLHDGNVKGDHLGKILMYLKITKQEVWNDTVYKLSLVCGMNSRYVRENYLNGLCAFGIIKTFHHGNSLCWKWIGEKAFNGDNSLSMLSDIPEPPPIKETNKFPHDKTRDVRKPENYDEYVGDKHLCKQCKKEIPEDKVFCNEKCLKKYYKEKKGDNKK